MDLFDTSSPIYVQVDGQVADIVLNRPARKNALDAAMWQRVAEAVQLLATWEDCRVVRLVSSTDGVFAAGADIKELTVISADSERREVNRQAIRDAQRSLARLAVPVVAVIDGPCVGGGCGLALHADFRIASPRSRFGITPARLGLVYPLSDMKRLVDTVGLQAARRLLLTAELISAEAAHHIGLIDGVADNPADMAGDLVKQLLALAPTSLAALKDSLQRVSDGQTDDDDATIQGFLDAHESADAKEGLSAFLEKRPAKFPGRL